MRSAPSWQQIAHRVASARASGEHVLVVVSALRGVTDALLELLDAGHAARLAGLKRLIDTHSALLDELGLDYAVLAADLATLTREIAQLPQTLDSGAWQRAEIVSFGERLSSRLGAAALARLGVSVAWLDARDWLCSVDQPSASARAQRLSASVDCRPQPAARAHLAAIGGAAITQGYVARALDRSTVLLGRGGSDTSAAYFGAILSACEVEIWTDVPGMFSANPRWVPDARVLRQLSYAEAQEIATTGGSVLHPRAIEPVREARVPIRILETARPTLPGTLITAHEDARPSTIKALSARRGVTLVSMESLGMWQQVGFLADVFAHFKRHGLSVDLIGSSETNVTVSLDPTQNLLDSDSLQRLCEDLEQTCKVRVIAPCAAITLVGRGIRTLFGRLAPVLERMDSERVHLVSQSSNDLNLTFVVDEARLTELVPELHRRLVQQRLIDIDDQRVFGQSARMLARDSSQPAPDPWWHRHQAQLQALAQAHGARYVYSLAVIRRQARALRDAVGPATRLYYAVKANANTRVLATLVAEGYGLECVSPGEIDVALATGIPPSQLLYTPNFASRADFAYGLERGVLLTLDHLQPLYQAPELFAGRALAFRLDLGRGLGHHDKVRTAGLNSKFGVPVDDLALLRERVQSLGLRVVALHSHAGSGVVDADAWLWTGQTLMALAREFDHVEFVNLGGGLGIAYQDEDPALDLAAFGASIRRLADAAPELGLALEPGRFLVAEAGVLVAQVTQTKRKGERAYVGLATGMNSLLRPALYGARHRVYALDRLTEPATVASTVVGPICETGDVLAERVWLPAVMSGETLLIADVGAYGRVMASHYNLRPPAGETVLDERDSVIAFGQPSLVRPPASETVLDD